ncbi:hypothetical protein WMY93_001457 [Mugilogobius chulae]|uniref:Uncharacterized protein n=1 Tax=Mugilogobius chulae TaxID=88201 RepID=A0AAW0Q2A2_9GOBI
MVDGEDVMLGATGRQRVDCGSPLSFIRQESTEHPPSLYRDIWSLRASLEQYASSDQSSTDRESIRSDADSVSSVGGAARSGLNTCLSQDLDDEPEGESEGEMGDRGLRGPSANDVVSAAVGDSESGNRKLLQMDSGYASIEAPTRAPEDMRLFGTSRGKTASERRLFFTNSGRKDSVCESVETRPLQEEQEDDLIDSNDKLHNNTSHLVTLQEPWMTPQTPSPHKPRLRRRDYSIDEKTDALFTEFLRHDPRFDQPDSPMRSRRRSRVHLRKQWQRHKQYSDPDQVLGGGTLHLWKGRASAADEEASETAGSEEQKEKEPVITAAMTVVDISGEDEERCENDTTTDLAADQTSHINPRVDNRNNNSSQVILSESSLADKLMMSVEERLYGGLRSRERSNHRETKGTVTTSQSTSPDFKPK